MLYVVRHDVELLLPATTWRCSPHKLSFAAYVDPLRDGKRVAAPLPEERAPLCEEGVNDILHAVPRRYFSALLRMVGGCDGTTCNTWQEEPKLVWPSCNEVCGCLDCSEADGKEETGDVTGHGCYSVLATRSCRASTSASRWPPTRQASTTRPPTLVIDGWRTTLARAADAVPHGAAVPVPSMRALVHRDGSSKSLRHSSHERVWVAWRMVTLSNAGGSPPRISR